MNIRDANQDSTGFKYVSKRVMINGQFVTLYSANGQTWVSSPEDLPALMERLDSVRVSLNTAERVAEGEATKAAEPEPKEKKEPQATPERALSTKYRVKGPKPRPILRQDGVVIKGTPIDPVSASSAVMSFSSDVREGEEKAAGKSTKSSKASGEKPKKLIAPVVSKKQTKAAQQLAQQLKKSIATSSKKTAKDAPAAPVSNPQKTPSVSKVSAQAQAKSLATKAAAAKVTPKAVAKPAAKSVAKPAAKKSSAKVTKQASKAPSKKAKASKKPARKSK
jgi:hypothetical protein